MCWRRLEIMSTNSNLTGKAPIRYEGDVLYVDELSLAEFARWAETPFYLYSKKAFLQALKGWKKAVEGLPALITFALKANDNLRLLELVAAEGLGADVVSGGELFLARKAGIPAERIVFAGVGKQAKEIRAALEQGVRSLNVESQSELRLINRIAGELGVAAPVNIRINPDIDPKSHPYISTGLAENKFGLPLGQAKAV
ncbi:MAG TPA: diaminopimelate decarboxylase, partial [Bacteroidetes bacterium]|nr:diaminopimelate decarboxylase [Bacteroidota bacterium]